MNSSTNGKVIASRNTLQPDPRECSVQMNNGQMTANINTPNGKKKAHLSSGDVGGRSSSTPHLI